MMSCRKPGTELLTVEEAKLSPSSASSSSSSRFSLLVSPVYRPTSLFSATSPSHRYSLSPPRQQQP